MAKTLSYRIALNKAMALCAGREMCYSDISRKLIAWGVRYDDSEKIMTHLTEGKFIDEERYSTAFAKDKFRYNKWGRIKIGAALRIKKIPDETINTALNSIDIEEYIELLKSIITHHRKSVRAKNQYDLKGKLLRHALAKGFESHLIYDLLNESE